MFERGSFAGKTAVVTGGGTGIGAATARLMVQLGARVVIASRTADVLEQRADEIRAATGGSCLAVPTDVRDEEQVASLIATAAERLGRIDILVNNAGGTRLGPLAHLPTKGWNAAFDLNARAAFFCTREAGRHMRAQGRGAIVNVSSSAGSHGVKGGAHYASAKAALQMFTRITSAEWGRDGVRANCVAVGMIASERAAAAWEAARLDLTTTGISLARAGTPEEAANAIVFLASDAASYITGQLIEVDGGRPMSGPVLD